MNCRENSLCEQTLTCHCLQKETLDATNIENLTHLVEINWEKEEDEEEETAMAKQVRHQEDEQGEYRLEEDDWDGIEMPVVMCQVEVLREDEEEEEKDEENEEQGQRKD